MNSESSDADNRSDVKMTVSDERLALIASGIETRLKAGASGAPDLDRDIASAITELQSLRRSSSRGVMKVNKLKWVKPSGELGSLRRAETPVGVYRVWTYAEADNWFWSLVDGTETVDGGGTQQDCVDAAQADYERRILSAIEQEQAEPVAWSYELATHVLGGVTGDRAYTGWEPRLSSYRPNVPEGAIRNLRPLFASPPSSPEIDEGLVERVAIALYDRFLERKAARNITFSPSTTPEWAGLVGSMKNDFIADARAALEALSPEVVK